MKRTVVLEEKEYPLVLTGSADGHQLRIDERATKYASLIHLHDDQYRIQYGEEQADVTLFKHGQDVYIKLNGATRCISLVEPLERAQEKAMEGQDIYTAPMPGIVVEINVNKGDVVEKGEALMTIESMKLLTLIVASRGGIVDEIYQDEVGRSFSKGAPLIKLV